MADFVFFNIYICYLWIINESNKLSGGTTALLRISKPSITKELLIYDPELIKFTSIIPHTHPYPNNEYTYTLYDKYIPKDTQLAPSP